MHLLILPYLDCSDSHAYTISLELCAGFNDSTHKTSLLHFESVILYAPLHKDKLRTTAGDRGGAGLFKEISRNLQVRGMSENKRKDARAIARGARFGSLQTTAEERRKAKSVGGSVVVLVGLMG